MTKGSKLRVITPTAISGRREEPPRLAVDAEIRLQFAHVFVAKVYHPSSEINTFRRDKVYWIDLCLTPRRPTAAARFCDHWNSNRFAEMGSLTVLPPRKRLELRSAGGGHASLICELDAEAVDRWLPPDFVWTERRFEAALNIASEPIRSLLLRLNHELREPGLGSRSLLDSIIDQLAIELARYFAAASDTDRRGGLASWRQRIIDDRIGSLEAPYPSVAELAHLCRLSTRQLNRAFRVSRGCSIADHLGQVRIDAAKRKLCTKADIRDIAHSLGFSTQSSFTAAFRRSTGTTPGEFRKRMAIARAT